MVDKLLRRIDTVFLPVRNLNRAIEWYTLVLGLSLRWQEDGYACLNVGETPLTIFEKEDHAPGDDHPMFNFYSNQIEVIYQRLLGAKVEVTELETHGGLKFFRFRDLDGNPLEVCWWEERMTE